MNKLLIIQNLSLTFNKGKRDEKKVLENIELSINQDQFHSIIGNSGTGKTVLAKTLIGLNPKIADISGQMVWNSKNYDLSNYSSLEELKGKEIAMIFQDPKSSLNPALSVKRHFQLLSKKHFQEKFEDLLPEILSLLAQLRIEDSNSLMSLHAHQLSGGMAQRVMIAMVIFLNPKLIIADEPTSNLDVTTSYEVLSLLKELTAKKNITVLHISHNLRLCLKYSTHLSIMGNNKIIETGKLSKILENPREELTKEFVSLINEGA